MEDDLQLEPVERRRSVRGFFPGVRVAMDETYLADDVSTASIFVHVDPERFEVGQTLSAVLHVRERRVACTLEVTRKEKVPRRGIALRIVDIAADQAEALAAAVDAASV